MEAQPSPAPAFPARTGLKPLLLTQALGAFNDNAWKMIAVVLLTAGLADDGLETQRRTMHAFVVFTLPLLVFSLPAGALADRVSKRSILVGAKLLELALLAVGTLLLAGDPHSGHAALVVLGLLGVHSALFSPAKYGILPELVPHERLSLANGQLEMLTFVAIIAGTAVGPPLLHAAGSSAWIAGAALTGLSAAGLLSALRIPRVPAAGGGAASSLFEAGRALRGDRPLWLAAIGSAWFWAIGSLLGQDVLVYGRSVLDLPDALLGLPLGAFGVGVGAGAVLAGRLSEGKVETGLIPLGAVLLALFTAGLGLFGPQLAGTLVLMGLMGVASGLLTVPLNALIQWRAPAHLRGGVIALVNVLVFGGMLAGSLLGYLIALWDVSPRGIFVAAAGCTLAGTIWAVRLLPEAFLRLVLFLFTHTVYRLRVLGREHVPLRGGVLLAPNHVSFADGLFLIATVDRPIRFIVDQGQFDRPLLRPFLRLLGAVPIAAGGGPRAVLKALRDAGRHLDEGEVVCIFPEGQITRTGALQPFRRGLERIAKGRGAPIVPVHLDRVWGSVFSYARGRFLWKLPEELPYRVTVSFGTPLPPDAGMAEVRRAVLRLGEQAWQERKRDRGALHRTFVRAARRRPWRFAMADGRTPRLSRLGVLAGAVALGRALRPHLDDGQRVGVLLPPCVPAALVNVAASLAGRTVVNLNYTTGRAGLESAIHQAGLRRVVTSREVMERLGAALPEGVEPLWIEDAAAAIDGGDRFAALLLALFAGPRRLARALGGRVAGPDDPAAILFSSGSTGEPKGVVLTHFNVDSNVESVAQVFRVSAAEDRLLGILPLFHSFGNLSLWFALNQGVGIVFHPDPLDAAAVGALVHRYRITLLLATPTFLSIYTRRCTPDQFGSLRLVLAGAEKLQPRVADAFEERFGIRPLEGYGATECSPVIATSIPSYRAPGFYQPGSRKGSVGPPVPGVAAEVIDPATREPLPPGMPGLLRVRGPNVMQGYLDRPDLTAQVLDDGWYLTGDLAAIDEDGFLRITDRVSRFSKIGGEMVPHGRVEEALHEVWAAGDHHPRGADARQAFAVTGVPDERKGERLAVLTTVPPERVPELIERLKERGLPNLFIPRADAFVPVDAIPVLGTGKVDLAAVKRVARERLDVPAG